MIFFRFALDVFLCWLAVEAGKHCLHDIRKEWKRFVKTWHRSANRIRAAKEEYIQSGRRPMQ